jgi:uncharacterized protein (DUF1330 family)
MWPRAPRHKYIGIGKITDKKRFVQEYLIPLRPYVRHLGGRMQWFYTVSPVVATTSLPVEVVVCISFRSKSRAHAFLTTEKYKKCLRASNASLAIFYAVPQSPQSYLGL